MNIIEILESVRSRVRKHRENDIKKSSKVQYIHHSSPEEFSKEINDMKSQTNNLGKTHQNRLLVRIAKNKARVNSRFSKKHPELNKSIDSAAKEGSKNLIAAATLDGSKKVHINDNMMNQFIPSARQRLKTHEVEHTKQSDEAYIQHGKKGVARLFEKRLKHLSQNKFRDTIHHLGSNQNPKDVKERDQKVIERNNAKYQSDALEHGANDAANKKHFEIDKKK